MLTRAHYVIVTICVCTYYSHRATFLKCKKCNLERLTLTYNRWLVKELPIPTVLRTVLTDFKNKHDLDISGLRNVQNFAKII